MKSVVICGSRRFKPAIREFAERLKEKGVVVFEPILHDGEEGAFDKLLPVYKDLVSMGLTYEHVQKIRCADVVYIYNFDGYAGVSTTFEIGVAVALAKPIYAFSDKDPENARRIVFREIISEPEELLKRLL